MEGLQGQRTRGRRGSHARSVARQRDVKLSRSATTAGASPPPTDRLSLLRGGAHNCTIRRIGVLVRGESGAGDLETLVASSRSIPYLLSEVLRSQMFLTRKLETVLFTRPTVVVRGPPHYEIILLCCHRGWNGSPCDRWNVWEWFSLFGRDNRDECIFVYFHSPKTSLNRTERMVHGEILYYSKITSNPPLIKRK